VWEANHVWLIFVFVVLWTGFRLPSSRLLDAVHPAEPGCVRDRPARSRLRVPAHRAPRTRPSPFHDRVRGVVGADAVLHGHGRRRDRGRPRAGRQRVRRRRTSWVNPLSLLTGVLFVSTGAYLASVFLVSDARRAGTADLERYFNRRALAAALVTGAVAAVNLFALHATRAPSSTGSRATGCRS
jgi:cytochrome d ubiquinol oxidase subunit II